MSSKDYFWHLARNIFLTPSNEVLDDCLNFFNQSQEDINLLKSIDTSNTPIHYLAKEISFTWDEFSTVKQEGVVENKHLLDSLLLGYAISSIKKSS